MLNICANDIISARSHFNSMSITERRKWLLHRLRNDSNVTTGVSITTKYIVKRCAKKLGVCVFMSVKEQSHHYWD